jgi:pimeloyl-ACP methyl ester carboxylesterase
VRYPFEVCAFARISLPTCQIASRRSQTNLEGFTYDQLLPLASAGFHVVAPDARGYGRSVTEPVSNYYRVEWDPRFDLESNSFSGRTIDVPACYIGGDCEWAVYQSPGAYEGMRRVCTQLRSVHLVRRSGHSIAEEQPERVNQLLLSFLRQLA